jgi:DNA ligase-1
VERLLESAERRGVEGVMLREPGSRYERKRSRSLLKVKSFGSSEAKITGHTEGTGKHRGRLGAYEVVSVKSGPDGIKPGVRFKIGTGISDRERDRPLRIGTVVTFTYQELTRAGVPRFPALVGAR